MRRSESIRMQLCCFRCLRFCIYVELNDTHIEGMAFLRDIEDDYYYYDDARFEVVGRNSGRRIAFGEEVWIRVKGVDMRRRTIDFELIVSKRK